MRNIPHFCVLALAMVLCSCAAWKAASDAAVTPSDQLAGRTPVAAMGSGALQVGTGIATANPVAIGAGSVDIVTAICVILGAALGTGAAQTLGAKARAKSLVQAAAQAAQVVTTTGTATK